MAEDQDQDQKTEEPTGKRLEEAREKGQLPISREIAMWVGLLGALLMFATTVPSLAVNLASYLKRFLESPHAIVVNDMNVQRLFFQNYVEAGAVAGLSFLILVIGLIAGYMVQTGLFFSFHLLKPDLAKLSPWRGLKKLFSLKSAVELLKSLGKLVVLGGVAYLIIAPIAVESPNFSGFPIHKIMAFLHNNLIYLVEVLLLVFVVIAVVDLFFTRYQYFRGLRMTKTEVKDEYKQQEGDPIVKSRLRHIRMERARKRMMAKIPEADVVITNPTHYAVALQYDAEKMGAPVVVAKGINLIALRIREIAEENRVPIVSNPPLARALHDGVEIDQQIPFEHFRAVAEVISYVYKLKNRKF